MNKSPIIELCVEDAASANMAVESGIDRIELCRELHCGGLTPTDQEVFAAAQNLAPQGLRVLVRENPSTFNLTYEEITELCTQVRHICQVTEGLAVGIVVGALDSHHTLDKHVLTDFRQAAGDRPLTFHRAFDQIEDQYAALDMLVEARFDSILTTGGDATRAQPRRLRELTRYADGRIEVIASGGLRADNVVQIVRETGAPAIHMRAPDSNGGTDPDMVRAILAALRE